MDKKCLRQEAFAMYLKYWKTNKTRYEVSEIFYLNHEHKIM